MVDVGILEAGSIGWTREKFLRTCAGAAMEPFMRPHFP
jgi:hypothetical protein